MRCTADAREGKINDLFLAQRAPITLMESWNECSEARARRESSIRTLCAVVVC